MADNQENFIYRIQAEGVDATVKAIDELSKKINFLSTQILKQNQLMNAFDVQLQKLNSTISQSASLSNSEKSQREAQINSISKQKKETEEYVKALEKELATLKEVVTMMQKKSGTTTTTATGAPAILNTTEASRALQITDQLALRVRQIKVELAGLKNLSTESFKMLAEGMIQAYAEMMRSSEEYALHQKEVEAEIRSYAKATHQAATELANNEKAALKNASEIKEQAIKRDMQLSQQQADQLKREAKEALEAEKGAKGLAGAFSKLGEVGKYVFGSVLGITAIGVLRSIVNWFKQAASAGVELATSMYSLATAIRAMQRVGVDITIGEVYENMESLRKEFGIFPWQDIVSGTAQIMNLTRTFKASSEELYKLQRAAFTLAVVNNRSIEDVQRVIALALSSGYTEGLQRLGISINKVTIANKAMTLGWKKGYNSLTEYQRYLSTQILILERVAAYEEDLQKYQESAPGRIKAVGAAWKDFGMHVGMNLVQPLANAADAFKELLDKAEEFTKTLDLAWRRFIADMAARKAVVELLKDGTISSLEEIGEAWRKYYQEGMDMLEEEKASIRGKDYLGAPKLSDYSDEQADEFLDALEKYGKDMFKLQEEYEESAKEADEKFGEDMDEIKQNYYDAWWEAAKKYLDAIKEIEDQMQEDILSEREELAKGIADANKEFNEKIAEENEKYRDNEIKAQKDYQEALRRLREEFLFDLEDALRKRDASQVMRLIRRYNLDKAQLDREKDEEKEENAKEHKDEIADIKKERDDRIKELREEFAERLAEIKKQADKERAEAEKERKEEQAEAERNYEEEKQARKDEYDEELKELKEHFRDRYSETMLALADEYDLTDSKLRTIGKLYENMFGKDGVIEGEYTYFADMTKSVTDYVIEEWEKVKQAADAALRLSEELSEPYAVPGVFPGEPGSWENPITKASGGRIVATRPTLALFGESGMGEVADFTPLNQYGSGGNGGRANIKISLAKGLIAEIVDDTMGQIGDIQLEVQR